METPPTEDVSVFYPALEVADASSDYYGSDFNSEDDDLLNELLSRISPLSPDDTTPSLENTPGPRLSSQSTTPSRQAGQTRRVLGCQNPHETVVKLESVMEATSEMSDQVTDDLDDAQLGGSCQSTVFQLGNANRTGKRLVKSEGSLKEDSFVGEIAPAEGGEDVDLRSPLERFRSPPMKPLSVTDLISPSWCELQYWYTLTKHGRKKKTTAMKQGSAVHKTLEDQVHQTVRVDVKTREDAWGLRIWNVIQGLRTLRETGMTREFEVWSVIDGAVVNGCIDELSYTCPDRVLEADATWTDQDADRVEETGLPTVQTTLDSYLRSSGAKNKSLETITTTPGLISNRRIYITDVKTRTTKSIPRTIGFRPTQLQLMIYHRLLSDLACNAVDPTTIFTRYRLDPSAQFTDSFIAEVGNLNHLQNFYEDIPSSQDSLDLLTEHNTLQSLWELMMQNFKETFPLGRFSIGDVLQAEYRSQADGSILGSKTFLYDENNLQTYLDDEMSWWKGQRKALGVPIEEAYKCRICEFADECEWRNGKIEEAIQTHRRRTKSVV